MVFTDYSARIVKETESSSFLSLMKLIGCETKNSEEHYLEIVNNRGGKTKRIKIGRTDYFLRRDPLNKGDFNPLPYYSGVKLSDLKFTKKGLEAKAILENGRYKAKNEFDHQLRIFGGVALLSLENLPN